jgi:hypothetical protein
MVDEVAIAPQFGRSNNPSIGPDDARPTATGRRRRVPPTQIGRNRVDRSPAR